MKIGVIQASSQINKNIIIYENTKKYAHNQEVVNFGCKYIINLLRKMIK